MKDLLAETAVVCYPTADFLWKIWDAPAELNAIRHVSPPFLSKYTGNLRENPTFFKDQTQILFAIIIVVGGTGKQQFQLEVNMITLPAYSAATLYLAQETPASGLPV